MKDPKRKRSNQTKEERKEEKATLVQQADANNTAVDKKQYPPKVPLNRCQINRAIKDHEDVHPLQQISDWHHISPVFNLCCVKKPMSFKFALKECLLKELQIPQSEEEWLEEPFLLLGFGTNTYFTILAMLQNMLLAITIFVIPLFYIYASGKHYDKSNPLDKLFIGNFGASTMFAKTVPLVNERMNIRCPKGTILDTDNAHFGILSNEFKSFIHCHRSSVQEAVLEKGYKDCELAVEWRKRSIFKDILMLLCKGKRECQIKPRVDDLFRYPLGKSLGNACDEESYMYMQIPCLVPQSKVTQRKLMGLFISCTAVFIFLFVQITLNYIKRVESHRFVDWDLKTVSAADYTVEFSISDKQYTYFEEHYLDTDSVISDIVQFKMYVKQEMEQRLTEFPALHLEDMDGDLAPVKIALITFAFDNAEVIHDLKKRGTYIRQEKWAKLEKVNRELVDKLKKTTKKGNSLLDKLQKPVSCFITMETEEGKCRADMYNEFVERPAYRRYQKFLGGDIDMQPAVEPTDIIWENRHFTVFQKFQRTIIVSIGIGLLLALSFYLILTAQINARNLKMKYPRQDCSDFKKEYSDRQLYWERDAINEYVQNDEIEDGGGFALYTGPMQCFCEYEKKAGKKKDQYYTLKGSVGKATFSEQICLDYANDKLKSKLYGLSITLIIVVINTILKMLIVKMVKWIGVDTVSQQMGIISKAVFLAQFFNTGIIILMVNANLVEHEPKEMTQIFRGQYTDYIPDWFLDVGMKIIVTYFVQSFIPFISLAKVVVVSFLKVYWDTKFTRDPYITRKTQMRNYAEIYSGGQFPIDLRFSEAMVAFFMAMTYGLGMPIMFPMAAVILANQRLCSRIFVAKFAHQPPSMDDAICKSVLQILNLAPFFSLFNWYWLMDSKRMFNNAWKYKMTVTESMMSSHLVEVTSLNQATPLLYLVFIATFVTIVRKWMNSDQATMLNLDPPEQQIPVDEDLPKFFDCIKYSDANILLAENKHLQEYYYFEVIRPELVQRLNEVGCPEREMQGTPWYNVTTNPTYSEMFSYVGPHVKNREKYIKDHDNDQENNFLQSDVVNIILNLSAIPDVVAKKLDLNYFDTYFNQDFIGYMEQYIENFSKIHNKKWQFADKEIVNEYLMRCKRLDPVWTIRNPEYYDLLLEDKLRYWKNKTKKSEETAFFTTLETSLKDNDTYGSGIRRYIESENRKSKDRRGLK